MGAVRAGPAWSPRFRMADGGRLPSWPHCDATGSTRRASSTDRSTAKASWPMSSRFWSRRSSPATSSSSTISAAIKARLCGKPSAPPVQSYSSCRPTARISIRSSRSSPSSKPCSAKLQREQSRQLGGASATCSQPSLRRNAPITSSTQDTLQRDPIMPRLVEQHREAVGDAVQRAGCVRHSRERVLPFVQTFAEQVEARRCLPDHFGGIVRYRDHCFGLGELGRLGSSREQRRRNETQACSDRQQTKAGDRKKEGTAHGLSSIGL